MTNSKKYLRFFSNIIFYVLCFFLIMYILLQTFIPSTTIIFFGFKPYNVVTVSMEPIINKDDMIFVRNPKLDDLEVGDIITFEADINYDLENEFVTHYIYSITIEDGERIFRTARHDKITGLPSTTPDIWRLNDDDILGVYWFRIPKLGLLVNFFQSPFGIATIVVNAIIIGVIIYLVKTDKKDKATDIKA
jgi:signal peptidase